MKQTWHPREACYGPVRSIFSLAPGESVQLVVSIDQHTSLVETVADHLPDVRALRLSPSFRGIAAAAASKDLREPIDVSEKMTAAQQMVRNTRYINGYGSLGFEDIVDPLGVFHEGGVDPHPPGPAEVVGAFTELIEATVGDGAQIPQPEP